VNSLFPDGRWPPFCCGNGTSSQNSSCSQLSTCICLPVWLQRETQFIWNLIRNKHWFWYHTIQYNKSVHGVKVFTNCWQRSFLTKLISNMWILEQFVCLQLKMAWKFKLFLNLCLSGMWCHVAQLWLEMFRKNTSSVWGLRLSLCYCSGFWSSGMLQSVTDNLIYNDILKEHCAFISNPLRWRHYIPAKYLDILKYSLYGITS